MAASPILLLNNTTLTDFGITDSASSAATLKRSHSDEPAGVEKKNRNRKSGPKSEMPLDVYGGKDLKSLPSVEKTPVRYVLGDDDTDEENDSICGNSRTSWDDFDSDFRCGKTVRGRVGGRRRSNFEMLNEEDIGNRLAAAKNNTKKISDGSLEFHLDEDSGLGFSAPTSGGGTDDEQHIAELMPMRRLGDAVESVRIIEPSKANFDDYYDLVDDYLGSGAYACVRTAISKREKKEYAVKLVDKHEQGHTRSRIEREVEIFKLCKGHPNIVQLIEWFEDDDYFYMVFEKMRGGQLLSRIQRKVCFTEQEAGLVTRDIARALKFLHDRGVAHRDVKPENILCTEFDEVSPVKLCDLDLASKPAHLTVSPKLPFVQSVPDLASPVGSAEFMAPEVVDAFIGESLKYDKRCDMWSLGVIIYIMLCGYPPFYGECERENCGWDQGQACADCQDSLFHRIQRGEFCFPEEEWGDVSDEAKDLICHLLVRNVRKRYTADDVLEHPWVVHTAPSSNTVLQTANNLLSRNDSTRDVHQMSELFKWPFLIISFEFLDLS
ncbi:protein kinase domain-containing protein [Ditylenchus destructor]|uniref:Protein kinase domain-containing protein n=1 Tax=Ditylenchus destructor TaxID=166010 RepID=A0AAD4N9S0_9BILA|nr:protein kinase domain-containing protein [Ditylenchus destructor]